MKTEKEIIKRILQLEEIGEENLDLEQLEKLNTLYWVLGRELTNEEMAPLTWSKLTD